MRLWFTLTFSSKSFVALVFILRPLLHFELIFEHGVMESNFIPLSMDISILKLFVMILTPYQNSINYKCKLGLFLDSQFYSIALCLVSSLLPVPHCLDCCSLVVSLEIGKQEPPTVFLFPQDCFWLFWGPFQFHMNFSICLSVSAYKAAVILIEVSFNI